MDLIEIRREFHRYPELSNQEYETQKRIIRYLELLNIDYIKIGTGIVGIISGNSPGKTIALRADIDALPIQELTNVSYSSTNQGVMHACGHDVHTTILLGAAYRLKQLEKDFDGKVLLVFEYAEETTGGAKEMVKHPIFDDCDFVLGLHVTELFTTGQIGVKRQQATANSDTLKIIVHGKNSHATKPHEGIDAILTSAYLLNTLQSVVTRTKNPLDFAVLTFGKISGGTAHNILCDRVTIDGTLRTVKEDVRIKLLNQIKKMCKEIGASFDTSIEIEINEGYPSIVNDDFLNDVLIQEATKLLKKENVIIKDLPSLGVDSFAYFTQKIKGAYYQLGIKNINKNTIYPTHSSYFNIDEDAISIGVQIQVNTTLALLNNHSL